jgi:Family of unknown function (DUF6348)
MFSWFRPKPEAGAPKPSKANPGIGTTARVAFANSARSWTEEIDIVEAAARVLGQQGHAVTSHKTWLQLGETGLIVQPQLVSVRPLDKGGVQTVTTVETSHPDVFSSGVFEYQHSTGDNLEQSITTGFDAWAQLDLLVLLDALRTTPESCTTFQMTFPAKDGAPVRFRRALLGPVSYCPANPPPSAAADGPTACPTEGESGAGAHPPFCTCCLLTNSFQAFKDMIEGDGFFGMRLFAMRDAEGVSQADCRVNGEDFELGATALREYVSKWPKRGFEFRKQYVVVQSVAGFEPVNT